METIINYHGHKVGPDQVAAVNHLILANPSSSRRALSFLVCEALNWKQPNGALCDSLCRSVLLALHRAGHIQLPEPQWKGKQPRRHEVIAHVEVEKVPIIASLAQLGPIEIRLVRRGVDDVLIKSLIAEFHYLGYVHPVGERLKYLITCEERPIACFCWSSAARHLGPRDRHIGWTQEARKANIRFIAYQSRFLILPWVKVPHLASYLLGAISRRLSQDWQQVYAHPIYFTETFVDPERYRGTCYRAANWTLLGITTGRGKADLTGRPNRSLKQVLGYPLIRDFRKRLCALVEDA